MTPKLLVSVKSANEVYEAIAGGADIIDVKDPSTSSLGLPRIGVVKSVVRALNGSKEVSVAIGDIRFYRPEIGYVVETLDSYADYVKVGYALNSFEEAEKIASEVVENATRTKIVFVGYADYKKHGFLEPMQIIDLASKYNVYGVMIDTFEKNGLSTFDILTREYLKRFAEEAKKRGLKVAIAGGLRREHIRSVVELGFDVVGVRTAVCIGGRNGFVSKSLVAELKREIQQFSALQTASILK